MFYNIESAYKVRLRGCDPGMFYVDFTISDKKIGTEVDKERNDLLEDHGGVWFLIEDNSCRVAYGGMNEYLPLVNISVAQDRPCVIRLIDMVDVNVLVRGYGTTDISLIGIGNGKIFSDKMLPGRQGFIGPRI